MAGDGRCHRGLAAAPAPPRPSPHETSQPLVEAVQTNCHIADARHAADLTLCTFLLQMREFYRWEKGLPLGAALVARGGGAWLARREALWADLEDQRLRAPARGRAATSIRSTWPR